MTENKRFQIIHLGNPYDFVVKDHNTNKTYGTLQGDDKSLMELLNELNDENQKLKSINQDYKNHLADVYADDDRLEEENEQLKKENECFKDKLCELGVSDVKGIDTGLEDWLND